MSTSSNLDTLLENFVRIIPNLLAAFVIDFNGFIIAKITIKKFDDELIGGIMSLLDQTLNRIKGFTQSKLGSGSFDIDQFRLFYIQLGKNTKALLVLIGEPLSPLDKYMPYAHILADRVSLILSEHNVSCNFPSMNIEGELILNKDSKNIILIGSEAVGKTSFARKCCDDSFVKEYQPTIGVSVIEKEQKLTQDNSIVLNIFDLSSLKNFAKVRRFFYSYSDVVLIMFDYSRIDTINEIKVWIEEARQFLDDTEIPFIVIGNKIDLVEDVNIIKEYALEVIQNYNYTFFNTSILTGEGIDDIFDFILQLKNDKVEATPLSSEFVGKLSEDERIIFISNITNESLDENKIPNILEKAILKIIISHKEISLAILINKIAPLEKALNRTIDRNTILKITEKYVSKGNIKRHYLQYDKDLETTVKLKMVSREDF